MIGDSRKPADRTPEESRQSVDVTFDLLSHYHRRYALDCLREHGTMSLADLVDEVAARDYGQPPGDIADHDRERVSASLYHTHIPKLAEADMVDYDQATETVTLGAAVEQATPFLTLVNDLAPRAV